MTVVWPAKGTPPAALSLDLVDYAGVADPTDLAVLRGVVGPVLDVGCGPGRLVAALGQLGVPALGIDVAPLALDMATARDAPALARSVFERIPGEGRWPTILLFDGNIGIGGHPVDLLARVAELLAPAGVAVAELESPGAVTQRSQARLDLGTGVTGWLPWATVGIDDIAAVAGAAGLGVHGVLVAGGRWFARLRRAHRGR